MKAFTKFSLRFAAYLLVIGYLAGDLYVFNGPLNRRIKSTHPDSPESIAKAKANGVVARVFNHQITRTQLDYAIHERLWLEGKRIEDLSPSDLKLVTLAALGELIDHQLLRVKVKVNTLELPVSDEEIDERLRRFVGKFETKGHLESAMKARGIPDETALRNRIAARIQQEKYVAMRVDPLVKVSEEEIVGWFEENAAKMEVPPRIRARHIFIATLGTPSDKAKQILTQALADLTAGKKDFSALAAGLSNDAATKANGGDLGWMSRSRLPVDFAEQVFRLGKNKPTLIRTKLGWHIVEVTETKPASQPTLEELRPEIIAALSATKRHQAVSDFRTALRRFETAKIDIFHDQLAP
jgi:parvulin-like peptidyl-prolyl isomerase